MADATNARGTSDLRVALIGAGRQGMALLEALTHPAILRRGARVVAVCDLWDHARDRAVQQAKGAGHAVHGYTEWTDLLERERDLDAVFIATPDRLHAPIARAAIAACLHLYVEPLLAQDLETARLVIREARASGRLVQVGYDRRSHPFFRRCCEEVWWWPALMGTPTLAEARHHMRDRVTRSAGLLPPVPVDRLRRHGYGSMHELLNWTRFRGHAGHLLPQRGPCQLDMLTWFLRAAPVSIAAAGGRDLRVDREVFDNVFALLAYRLPSGRARACYQASSMTCDTGCRELFAGTHGRIAIRGDVMLAQILKERSALPEIWDKAPFVRADPARLQVGGDALLASLGEEPLGVGPSRPATSGFVLRADQWCDQPLVPHVGNFLAAIRGEATLNAPAEAAFVTEVVVRKIAEAIAAKREIELTDSDFSVA